MAFSDKKEYLIDDKPVSARELIDAAGEISEEFLNNWCKRTSEAAEILRNDGSVVEVNQDN